MVLAAELCALARCGMSVGSATTSYAQGRPAIVGASMVAGLGVGIGTSLWATRKGGILPGHATALNSGVIWGASFGTLVNFASDNVDVVPPSYGLPVPRIATPALILGQLGGMGLGAGLYQWLEPTQGDVALTNSFGLWGAAFTVGAFGLANDFGSPWALSGTLMASSTVAAVGGGILANFRPMSRGRVWIINASGILGSLAGVGIGHLVSGGTSTAPLYAGSGMAGAAAGLGIGTWLTDGWSYPGKESSSVEAQLHLAPSPRGQGGMVKVSGSF
jgi:hypothetical protein